MYFNIRQISFDNNEEMEMIEGSAGADHIDFILIPDSPTITTSAELSATLKGKVYGYEYTSRNAAIENERSKNPNLTLKDRFPGRFFSSFRDASIERFESTYGVPMLPIESLQLKRNARYIIVTTGPNVSFRARNVPSPQRNTVKPFDVNNDGMIGTTDFARVLEHLNNASTPKVVTTSMPTPPYLDTTGDWNITTADSLAISNYKSSPGNPFCGNGLVEPGNQEQCDDNNDVNTDGCTNLCKTNASPLMNTVKPVDVNGDGYVGQTDVEAVQSYLTSSNPKNVTSGMSAPPYLDTNGDWVISPQDMLLIGNYNNGVNAYCGNQRIELQNGETCDDGNAMNSDGCSNSCKKNVSPLQNPSNALDVNNDGSVGLVDAKAIQEYLNTSNSKNVTNDMPKPPYFDTDGDWTIAPQDMLRVSNANSSTNLFCGNGVIQEQNREECDDGNEVNDDSCRNDCTLAASPF